MSTREQVHTIVDALSEEQLKAFLVIFGSTNKTEVAEKDVAARKKAAYEDMKRLIRKTDIPDEKEALAEYRRERYGV